MLVLCLHHGVCTTAYLRTARVSVAPRPPNQLECKGRTYDVTTKVLVKCFISSNYFEHVSKSHCHLLHTVIVYRVVDMRNLSLWVPVRLHVPFHLIGTWLLVGGKVWVSMMKPQIHCYLFQINIGVFFLTEGNVSCSETVVLQLIYPYYAVLSCIHEMISWI